VSLEVRLEVKVGNRVLVSDLKELGESTIGDDTPLVGGVKAAMGLDVLRNELGNISLRALRTSGDTKESAELRGDLAGLEERIVRPTSLPSSLLLGGHIGNILLSLLLLASSLDLTGSRLGSSKSLTDNLLELAGNARLDLLETICNRGKRVGLGGSSGSRLIISLLLDNGDIDLGLGSGLATTDLLVLSSRGSSGGDGGLLLGLLGGYLLGLGIGGGHRVCI